MQQQGETSRQPHGMLCSCGVCSRNRSFHDTRLQPVSHITRSVPSSQLPASTVSVLELLGNSRVDYSVGEDWNDD